MDGLECFQVLAVDRDFKLVKKLKNLRGHVGARPEAQASGYPNEALTGCWVRTAGFERLSINGCAPRYAAKRGRLLGVNGSTSAEKDRKIRSPRVGAGFLWVARDLSPGCGDGALDGHPNFFTSPSSRSPVATFACGQGSRG